MKIKQDTKFQTMIQFTRFAFIGASGTIMSLAILYILTEFFSIKYWISLPIGYFLGITNNFIWNRKFTFNKTGKPISIQYFEYLLSMLLGGLANYFTTIILTENFNIWYFLSAILAVSVSTVVDFTLSKLWVFGQYYIYIIDNDEPPKEIINVKLIVSCLNEEENISQFVQELMTTLPSKIKFCLILINNGSTDKTDSIINKLAQNYPNEIVTIHREKPLQYGESIKKGLEYPLDFKPDYVGWAWSDNQITGKSVTKVLSGFSSGEHKFVKAFRHEKDYSLWRKIQSFFFNILVSISFGERLQDVNGCPKIIASELMPILDLQSRGWFIDTETCLKITRLIDRDDIIYVPVPYNKRIHGKSKTSWITAFELFYQLAKFRFWGLWQWSNKIKASYPLKTDPKEDLDQNERIETSMD